MQSPDVRLVTETKLANVGVTLWKAATSYKQGQAVLSPTGVVVTALADFTSNSSYDATKWSAPNIGVTDYNALTNRPTLGTAASQPSTAFDAAGAASVAQSTAAVDASTKDAALAASVAATYSTLLPPVGLLTYDGSGNVTQDSSGTTYTYNPDGSVHTLTKAGVTRTLSYNSDGTIAAVA